MAIGGKIYNTISKTKQANKLKKKRNLIAYMIKDGFYVQITSEPRKLKKKKLLEKKIPNLLFLAISDIGFLYLLDSTDILQTHSKA